MVDTGPSFGGNHESLQLKNKIYWAFTYFWVTLTTAVRFNAEAFSIFQCFIPKLSECTDWLKWALLACSVHVDMDGCRHSICKVWFVCGYVSRICLDICRVKFSLGWTNICNDNENYKSLCTGCSKHCPSILPIIKLKFSLYVQFMTRMTYFIGMRLGGCPVFA